MMTPCCSKKIEFEAVLSVCEWSSNAVQWEFRQWNYYRCPLCNTPCWFGYDKEGGVFGIYGAAPVADLIPVHQDLSLPPPEIGMEGVTFRYNGNVFVIKRGKHY